MIVTLSPAKLLDFDSEINIKKSSKLQFAKQASELNKVLQQLSKDDIADLMNISPELTQQVHNYIHTYETNISPERQAIFAFNGIAYQGLEPKTLSEDVLDFAQNHMISFSGLYGIIRPLDIIKPYRLEMGRELANPKGKNIYAYWSNTITEYLSQKLQADDNTWINLTSNEYAKVVNKKKLPKGCRIISPQFKEDKGDSYKQIVVYTKKARGMMTRFILENKLTDPEHIKAFDYEGYTFAPRLSNDKDWVFIR